MSMSQGEIVRRNEAIARFWGWKMIRRNDDGHCDWWMTEAERLQNPDMSGVYHGQTCFNSSWNSIMPVAIKMMKENRGKLTIWLADGEPESFVIESVWLVVSDYCLSLEPQS